MERKVETHHYNTKDSDKIEIKAKWWNQDEKMIHAHVKGVVEGIKQHQNYRYVNNLRFARLYANQTMFGLRGGEFARTGVESATTLSANRMSWNVIKACIDTVCSKIAKNKPRPLYLTDDREFLLQRKARNLTNFMQAQFLTMGTGQGDNKSLYGVGRQVFGDSCIFGLGVAKLFKDDGKVFAERILPSEIVVDDIEGRYQSPRQIHQDTLMSREMVCDLFPKHADKIAQASSGTNGESSVASAADVVSVTESWHLRSGKNQKDGRRALSIENCTLAVEDWEKDYFPFLFQRWNNNVLGFYGIGIAEELMGIQLDINKGLRRIAQAQHLMAVPQAWLDIQSKTVTSQMNNQVGSARYYAGRPPVFLVPQAMSAEVYRHLENQYGKAFEIVGVSQLSAQSKKPSGLDSGKALREFQDIESERFALAQIRYEDFFMDAADMTKDMLRDIAEEGEDPVVNCQQGDSIMKMRWKDVDIPDDRCSAKPYPTNFLSQTPSGKLADAQELMQAGIFDREEGLEIMDFPDIKAHTREKLAPREANRMLIESALYDGKYVPPEPFMDLQRLLPMAQNAYLKAKVKNCPEDRLELLRRLIDDTDAMLNPEPPPMPEMDPAAMDPAMDPAMAGVDPAAMVDPAMMDPAMAEAAMAQPEALPVSDLIPQG